MLKMCKLMLTTVAHAKVQVVVDACSAESQGPPISVQEHHQAAALQQALHFIPTPESEFTLRGVATRLGQHMGEQVTAGLSFLRDCADFREKSSPVSGKIAFVQ